MPNAPIYLRCCDVEDFLQWREASELEGPESDGWTIQFTGEMYGDSTYVRVNYCPFCGKKVPDGPPSEATT